MQAGRCWVWRLRRREVRGMCRVRHDTPGMPGGREAREGRGQTKTGAGVRRVWKAASRWKEGRRAPRPGGSGRGPGGEWAEHGGRRADGNKGEGGDEADTWTRASGVGSSCGVTLR